MEKDKIVKVEVEKHRWEDEIIKEKKKRKQMFTVVLTGLISFVVGISVSGMVISRPSNHNINDQKFNSIYNIMDKEWYFGKDMADLDQILFDNAIRGLVSSEEDPHTMYMDVQQSEQFASSLSGNMVGIGVQYYAADEHTFIISSVFKDSPAEAGGLKKGDQLIRVDGDDITKDGIENVAKKVKGEEGTKVTLTIIREGKSLDITMTRKQISTSVYGEIKDGVAILTITTFGDTTAKDARKILEDFKEQKCQAIVIDLRDNGGGYLDTAVELGSYFMPKNTVIFQEEKRDGSIEKYKTISAPHYEYQQITILVNENTASASEVLASSLQENVGARLVGVKTYGKGTVQRTITFKDGSSFKFTIAQWLTSKGKAIHNVGIMPDIEVQLDPALSTPLPEMKDDEFIAVNTVTPIAKSAQTYLKFLGYNVDRSDEYFSPQSQQALMAYQKNMGLTPDGKLTKRVVTSLLSSTSLKWSSQKEKLDVQMKKALEISHE